MKKGFSLIELMVVVVIIGILAAIAIPNFIRLRDRAKDAEVKSNAHTTQLAAEEYSTNYDGNYSDDFAQLVIPANIKNPFTGLTTPANSIVNDNMTPAQGFVGYCKAGYDAQPYTIVGMGKDDIVITLSPGQ